MWEHVIESSRLVLLRNWWERKKMMKEVMKIKIVKEDKK